jgi:hypothetical protein
MIGVKRDRVDQRVRPLLPGYMTMGHEGMGDMGDMGMPVPRNSIPMVGAKGPHDYITMGGMFTVLRCATASAATPTPAGTRARRWNSPAPQLESI